MHQRIRFDHVGITVEHLEPAISFFESLNFEVEGRTFVEGEFIDTVTGIPGSRSEIVMLSLPGSPSGGGATAIEVSSFVRPAHTTGTHAPMANEVGLRSLAFEIEGLDAKLAALAADGYGLVGGVGEYEGAWRMAYVRGPEGIIVALAERVKDLSGSGD